MRKELTCVTCPLGCLMEIEFEEGAARSIEGARCARGMAWAEEELIHPRRNLATSVLVRGGREPLASVRLTGTIPLERVESAMREIATRTLDAPVRIGQPLVRDLLGLGVDVVATRNVEAAVGLRTERME